MGIINCAERVDITEGYNVYYNITGDYGDTYSAEMFIENTSDTDISAWQLSFDGNATIDNLWNGKLLENENGSFKVKNAEHNVVIGAGNSASFNFSGTKLSEGNETTVTETSATVTEPVIETTAVTDVSEEAVTEVSESDVVDNESETEATSVSEQKIETASEVVFGNFKLTAIVIPLEFDFEIDPEMDSDEDGLPDYIEKEIGSDRYNPDTDRDGLPDGYEYFTLATDPTKVDTDDNGISDADEDFDEDGLSNLEEYNLGTDPLSKDTDGDGLSDYDEVNIYNTDPLKYDTDGDVVSDGDEIELGLDPNNPATNGYPDNEYTTKQTVGEDSEALDYINNIEDNPYTVSVEITAAGVAENNLSAGESGYSYSILQNDAVLGVVPELSYSDGLSVTDVVINFNIDASQTDTSIDDLMVFKYFEDTNMLLPIETTYNETTNTVSTHVDEVGTYCLIDVEKWLEILEEMPVGNYYEGNEPANIVFCLDTRSVIDEESFNAVKEDIKAITENAFDRYSDIKVYVYYQQFGSDFKAENKLLTDSNGNNYFTGYEEAVAALEGLNTEEYWAYDFVEATQFMIDNCDENIIAMYHITADDRVMGGINKAKKLTQTVQNSKYTTAEGEEIQRIYVSTLCPNDTEPFDTSSYAYELATLSGGIAVTGYVANEDTEVMTAEVESVEVYANDEEETKTSSNVKNNLTDILGEGMDLKDFKIISSAGLTEISLKTPLRINEYYTSKSKKPTDTDEDGLYDWDEVCINAIEAIKGDNIKDGILLPNNMPSLLECMTYYNKHSKGYVGEGFLEFMKDNSGNPYSALNSTYILPINSNPVDPDSDGDGIVDCITYLLTDKSKNDDRRYYDTEFSDPNPLVHEFLWQWPVIDATTGDKISNVSGGFEDERQHGALDITEGKADTIVAAYDGEIVAMYYCNCGTNKCLGNYIIIKHLINGKAYYSRYGHLRSFEPDIKNACMNENNIFVSGIKVTAGQKIATMGGTCDYPIHLDFQIGELNKPYEQVESVGLNNDDLKYIIDPALFNKIFNKYRGEEKKIVYKKYNMLLNIPYDINNICKQGVSCNDCKKYFDCTLLDSCECEDEKECTCCIKHKYDVKK